MNERLDRDEMIHAYVDGELSSRQMTEFKRLLDRDPSLRQQVEQVHRMRQLVAALPREEAPADVVDQVLMVLERKTLLGDRPVPKASGALRARWFSHLKAVAAIVPLLLALGVLVYSIVAPTDNAAPGPVATDIDLSPAGSDVSELQLAGRLLLTGAGALRDQVDRGLRDCGLPALRARADASGWEVSLHCSVEQLRDLMRHLSDECTAAADARLTVTTLAGQPVASIEVPAVRPSQIVDLVGAERFEQASRLALDMATENRLNPLPDWTQDRAILPIPVLTETYTEEPRAESVARQVLLTLVIRQP